jgi:hypothetical protein
VHPAHFFYFSRATLARLLRSSGLEPESFRTTTHWRSVENMANQVGYRARSSLVRRALFGVRDSPLGRVHVPLDLGDIMFVIARKA